MIFPAHIRIAISSLRSTRVRTALTTLGIIIGVFSITLVLALGEGAKQTIAGQMSRLEGGIITIKPGGPEQRQALSTYNPFAISPTSTLTERDVASIHALKLANAVAPIMFVSGSVSHSDRPSIGAPIIATSSDFANLMKLNISSGQFVSEITNRDTVVLGSAAAASLLGTNQARGQEVLIKGRPHTVIGVVGPTNTPLNVVGVSLDHSVFVNLEDGKSFNQGIAQIQQMMLRVKDAEQSAHAARAVETTLLANHENEADFSVIEGKDVVKSINTFYNIVVIMTAAVAATALLVGGIGIMNIMLVSVTERTREIDLATIPDRSPGYDDRWWSDRPRCGLCPGLCDRDIFLILSRYIARDHWHCVWVGRADRRCFRGLSRPQSLPQGRHTGVAAV